MTAGSHPPVRFVEIEPGVLRHRTEEPGAIPPGWARVAVRACGLCGTDLHLWHGMDLPAGTQYPVRPGHEVAGIVSELEPGGQPSIGGGPGGLLPIAVGDEVVLHPVMPCGQCEACSSGRTDDCAGQRILGIQAPGGLATSVLWPASRMVPVPGLDPRQAAILADAVATARRALRSAELPAGGTLCVLGAGGVGTHVLQLARLLDPSVRAAGVVRSPASAGRLRDGGFDAFLADDSAALRKAGPFDAVIDFSGDEAGPALGMRMLRRGGTYVLGSVLNGALNVGAAVRIQTRELTVRGVFASSMTDLAEVAALACGGALDLARSVTHEYSLSDAEAAFAALRDRPPGMLRVVLLPAS
jgi:propanol-preferring alcohol dehydrogenase